MPTVHRVGKARVVIFPNDHSPPHVHVIHGDRHARISIRGPVPKLLETVGFSKAELRHILEEIDEVMEMLNEQWEQIHGERGKH